MGAAQPDRYRIHDAEKLAAWAEAHPEHRDAIAKWRTMFEHSPFDPTLRPFETENELGETIYEYDIPGVPIVIAVVIEMQPDGDGTCWAELLRPSGPHDVVPDAEMI